MHREPATQVCLLIVLPYSSVYCEDKDENKILIQINVVVLNEEAEKQTNRKKPVMDSYELTVSEY